MRSILLARRHSRRQISTWKEYAIFQDFHGFGCDGGDKLIMLIRHGLHDKKRHGRVVRPCR